MNKIYKKIKEKIKNNNLLFIFLSTIRAYGIYFLNKISHYKLEKIRFYKEVGYPLNLKNPKSFNEKIVWKKIYNRNPLLLITADKHEVRTYIKKALGEERAAEILIPLLYVTDQPDTIPIEMLPSDFIVKPTHASGLSIIVKNGHFNQKEMIKTCRRWLKTSYGLEKLEWAYQPIKRKIIIEKLLLDDDGKIAKDFKFNMFHGKCKLILVDFDRMNNPSGSYFDEKWDFLSVKKATCPQGPKIKKPKNYEIMLELVLFFSSEIRADILGLKFRILDISPDFACQAASAEPKNLSNL